MKDWKYLQLFDVYGARLTEHQRDVCELYYLCDLSLTEIAEEKGVSKQGVSDMLAKSRSLLDDYESKLHFCYTARETAQATARRFARVRSLAAAFKAEHPAYVAEMDAIVAACDSEENESAARPDGG